MAFQRIVKDYDVRRLEFLNGAKDFLFTSGYQKMSVSMLTQKVGVAKGTFYHYFSSKEDLLTQWVIHELKPIMEQHRLVLLDDSMNALEKLNKIMQQGREWDLEHLDVIIPLMTILYDKHNVHLLNEMTKQSILMAEDIFNNIVVEGVQEGLFDTQYPEDIATRLIQIGCLYSEDLGRSILRIINGEHVVLEELLKVSRIWEDIMERILGAPKGSIVFVDKQFLKAMITQLTINKEVKKSA